MYNQIFSDVVKYLSDNDGEATKSVVAPFRKRSEHIRRVYIWASRLLEDMDDSAVDKEAVLISALFHDVGYAVSVKGQDHAEASAAIFNEYAVQHGYSRDRTEAISFLIRNHSNKALLLEKDTPLELILLMEADLLDETGALSIVWDCMMEGAQSEQSFAKTHRHIVAYSGKILDNNPMVTDKAKALWRDKQNLTREFMRQLAYDLAE
jgi:uncharacterized protein